MILLLILVVVLIGYALRKAKYRALKAEQFPKVPPEKFAEWQTLKLRAINKVVWATLSWVIVRTIGVFFFNAFVLLTGFPYGEDLFAITLMVLLLYIIIAIVFDLTGRNVVKIEKEYGISV